MAARRADLHLVITVKVSIVQTIYIVLKRHVITFSTYNTFVKHSLKFYSFLFFLFAECKFSHKNWFFLQIENTSLVASHKFEEILTVVPTGLGILWLLAHTFKVRLYFRSETRFVLKSHLTATYPYIRAENSAIGAFVKCLDIAEFCFILKLSGQLWIKEKNNNIFNGLNVFFKALNFRFWQVSWNVTVAYRQGWI